MQRFPDHSAHPSAILRCVRMSPWVKTGSTGHPSADGRGRVTVAAACKVGATIVLPGTVYNFGPDAFPVLTEESPQHPNTRKGAIRVEMERRLLAASKNGARVLIVRAGDFFGPKAANNWFSQGLVKPGKPITVVSYPGRHGVGHQWSYLPDVARTMVELLTQRDSLAPFATFHMAGHLDADGSQMVEAIQRVVARRTGWKPRATAFPWWLLTLASPFVARSARYARCATCGASPCEWTMLGW
jgi:nucleoside-diphosphate-sugar epimerase